MRESYLKLTRRTLYLCLLMPLVVLICSPRS